MPLVPPWTSTVSPSIGIAALEQVGPHGEQRLGQRRRLDHGQRRGHRQALAPGRDGIFGIAAAGDQRADRLAEQAPSTPSPSATISPATSSPGIDGAPGGGG